MHVPHCQCPRILGGQIHTRTWLISTCMHTFSACVPSNLLQKIFNTFLSSHSFLTAIHQTTHAQVAALNSFGDAEKLMKRKPKTATFQEPEEESPSQSNGTEPQAEDKKGSGGDAGAAHQKPSVGDGKATATANKDRAGSEANPPPAGNKAEEAPKSFFGAFGSAFGGAECVHVDTSVRVCMCMGVKDTCTRAGLYGGSDLKYMYVEKHVHTCAHARAEGV
jgi:hypothetical protein